MPKNLELSFRVGPVPVRVEPWFWLSGLLLASSTRDGPRLVVWMAVFFVSILVHELGHAFTARAFGARASVRLHSFGGVTIPDRNLPRGRAILMTLAGPGAGFVLAGLAWWLTPFGASSGPLVAWALGTLVMVNVFWGLMNLLPVPPLDGGLVMVGALGPRRLKIAYGVGALVSLAVVLGSLKFDQLYIAILFGFFCWQNVQSLRAMGSSRGSSRASSQNARRWE